MEQPTLTINRLRQELDEKCEKILIIMVLRGAYESDPIRYNELFRIVKSTLEKISKPTFNDHLEHLIGKKLIKRKRVGKQETRFYLNISNLKIANLREMKEQVDKNTLTLTEKITEQNWINAPTLLAWTFAICELRRTRIILQYFLIHEKANENILAIAYQAKSQEALEELILGELAKVINEIKDPVDKEAMKNKMVETLDQAIVKMETALSNLMKKQ